MTTRTWVRRPLALAAAMALAVILPACGGGSSGGGGTTPPVTTPPAPVRTLIQQGNFTIGRFPEVATVGVTIAGAGTVEIVVDWTFSSNDLDAVFYNGNCTPAQATNRSCSIIAITTSTTAKPERLTITNVAAGTYTAGVASFLSSGNESGNYQVYLTR